MNPNAVDETDRAAARVFRALGHPARLAILRLLAERRSCVCGDIVDELPLAQSTVSQHLKVLKEAGIIVGEIDGPAVCYCLAPGALDVVRGVVGRFVDALDPEPVPVQVWV